MKENILSLQEISDKYQVNISTVSRINSGKTHNTEDEEYPLRKNLHSILNRCIKCGTQISANATFCVNCYKEKRRINIPDRDILKSLIREKSFVEIGKMYNVSDNAIRKWCISMNLPFKKKDIKIYSDEEWEKI